MGIEIERISFDESEWPVFVKRIKDETALLAKKAENGESSLSLPVGGFEIEAWLVDDRMRPVKANKVFLEICDSELATMELAQFNFEINNTPQILYGDAFKKFAWEMRETCEHAHEVTEKMGIRTLAIGILPTLQEHDFCLDNMSDMKRYKALNEQVLRERNGRALKIDIEGSEEVLKFEHNSVMLEAAATSFQIHTQIGYDVAHHYYNGSILASAAMVAVSANSPYLFGKQLWHETRIPIFEQSVDTGEGKKRVSFGSGFAKESILECFQENIEDYDVLLPIFFEDDPGTFAHLKLHNGTIWRWNRPLIGTDPDGTLHFRIEHRVMSAGPTLVDMLANAMFYYGLAMKISDELKEGKSPCDFETAEQNFYTAAKEGLACSLVWEGKTVKLRELILKRFLPMAREGMALLEMKEEDINFYFDIIEERVKNGQNGAAWQISYIEKYGHDFEKMTKAYWRHQQKGDPVHTWEVK
jgi:gamma-glutamyl:cysteine ligase YbdK (ATP-grasp superfamily)